MVSKTDCIFLYDFLLWRLPWKGTMWLFLSNIDNLINSAFYIMSELGFSSLWLYLQPLEVVVYEELVLISLDIIGYWLVLISLDTIESFTRLSVVIKLCELHWISNKGCQFRTASVRANDSSCFSMFSRLYLPSKTSCPKQYLLFCSRRSKIDFLFCKHKQAI